MPKAEDDFPSSAEEGFVRLLIFIDMIGVLGPMEGIEQE
jgi:hypothetical protein